jgi:hypothetical protein
MSYALSETARVSLTLTSSGRHLSANLTERADRTNQWR